MRYRLAAVVTVLVTALAVAGSAFGFDCIRVSSSLQGLQQSTKSGNWLLFNLSSADAIQETFANFGEELTDEEAECFADLYAESGEPLYFALGIGVAGPNGVLAWNNDNPALSDGRRHRPSRADRHLRGLRPGRRGVRGPRALERACQQRRLPSAGPSSWLISMGSGATLAAVKTV